MFGLLSTRDQRRPALRSMQRFDHRRSFLSGGVFSILQGRK
jgi:hypothetical protein